MVLIVPVPCLCLSSTFTLRARFGSYCTSSLSLLVFYLHTGGQDLVLIVPVPCLCLSSTFTLRARFGSYCTSSLSLLVFYLHTEGKIWFLLYQFLDIACLLLSHWKEYVRICKQGGATK